MTTEQRTLAKVDMLEAVLVRGDLASLTGDQRLTYYRKVCESIGLNPLTRPFDYIMLNGKLTLYARRDATDQLRNLKKVSITITAREFPKDGGLYIVTAKATTPEGRTDESTGAVAIDGLRGDALANACMKAETKAKRRVTLSICGLGLMDETEAETVTEAWPVSVDMQTGEIQQPARVPTRSIEPPAQTPGPRLASQKQIDLIYRLAKEKGHTREAVDARIMEKYHVNITGLTMEQASAVIDSLQSAKKPVPSQSGTTPDAVQI